MQAEQAEAEQDERERGAVVEPGLAGQREAQPVAIGRLGDLHVGGEHRIGRREDAAEQDRRAERQAEPGDAGPAMSATVTSIDTIARRSGSSQRPSLRPTLIFRPEPNSDSSTTTSAMLLERACACDVGASAASRARAG